MLKLTGGDRQKLREAITSGFRNYPSLKRFVSDNFDDLRLNEIARSTATKEAADDLIEHFEETGGVPDLILALYKERPRNPEVQSLLKRLQDFLQQRLLLDPRDTGEIISFPFELPFPYDEVQLESFLPRPFSYETDVGTLRRGLQLVDTVCRVSFSDRATMGTGVLIASNLVLTNYHVLSREVVRERSQLAEKAKTVVLEFGFISEEQEALVSPDTFTLEGKDPILACSPPAQLDYALLRVESAIARRSHVKPVRACPSSFSLMPKAGLNVLQHPNGEVMQVSLSASGVIKTDAERGRVWYVNRTKGGSSGSPCFDSKWELVALHHASMSSGFGSVREGILLPSILTDINQQNRQITGELFEQ